MGDQGTLESDFEKICTTKANGVHPVTKYRSKSSGLEVVHAEIEGPIVNGYIVLATQTDNDEGIPHTLEHMIFMGSEDYPFKGVLDILANKCLASGTNAWTDVDHTCYTLTTAGQNGFCFLLPIYLDHLYFPLLTDEAFLLEVHHVTGEGEDGGVVYSELLAKENTALDKSHVALSKALYTPSSGYYYIAGGVMKNVRESCNNEKVKKFHKKFYVPRNTRIIVCGIVEPKKLFEALAPVVAKLIAKGKVTEWKNPWLDSTAGSCPVKASKKDIYFPAEGEDEECLVTIGMRGPCNITQVDELAALRIVFEYLTDSSVGPLQLEFTEHDEGIASNVNYGELENAQTSFYIEFEDVSAEDVGSVVPRLKTLLKKQIESFNLDRMQDIIRTQYQEEISSMENRPHNAIAYASIADFLFGVNADTGTFDKRINMGRMIQGFLDFKSSDWTKIIKERILDQNWVIINARPSEKEYESWMKSEENRVDQRIKTFGEPGLRKLEVVLENATAFNQKEIPSSLMDKLITPSSTAAINFHQIKRYQNPEFAKDFSCNVFVDDINSNFVYINIHMDTSALSNEQRKYLSLFKEILTESPVMMDDGTILPYEDVVATLTRELLSYGCTFGIDGSPSPFKTGAYSHVFAFVAQIQLEKADVGFDWIRRLLFHVQWDADRIKILANKMATEVTAMKRKGNKIAKTLLKDLIYSDESNPNCMSFLRQQSFLKKLAASLPAEAMSVKKMMESIRLVLTDPKNITIHIASSLKKLKGNLREKGLDFKNILSQTFPTCDSEHVKKLANEPDSKWMKSASHLKENPNEIILGLKGVDAAYLVQVAPGVTDYNDPEYVPLLLAMQYFCHTEGPLYRSIRGGGFAYGFHMGTKPSEGLIYFHLTECANVVGAYKASQNMILSHLNGTEEWTDILVQSAKSSLSFEVIEGEKTPLLLSSTSLSYYYRGLAEGYSRKLIERIEKVSVKELKEMTEKYIAPMFSTNSNCVVVASTDQVKAITEGLNSVGKNMKRLASLDDAPMSKWIF